METIGVVGAGAWGTALAQVLSAGGRDVRIWAREAEVIKSINESHENAVYLPGIPLHENLKADESLEKLLERDIILLVSPAQHLRSILDMICPHVDTKKPLIICSKGIEISSGLLLSQVADDVMPDHTFGILTGPTFASEIAKGLPSAVTLALKNEKLGLQLQDALGVDGFRPYITTDMIGTQLGGAIKNVIAIACGIITGKGLGESARAALLTRGIAEIARLAVAMGAERTTLLGMCGIGDLMLTCSSMQSRNFSLGVALGKGKTLDEVLGPRKAVTEGVHTAKAALKLAKSFAVDMPITEAVNKLMTEEMPIDSAIDEMLYRPFKYKLSKSRERRRH